MADHDSELRRAFSERILYDGPELSIGQLDVEMPNRERVWWDVVHLYRSVSVIVVDENRQKRAASAEAPLRPGTMGLGAAGRLGRSR
jgi:hypothetical protein